MKTIFCEFLIVLLLLNIYFVIFYFSCEFIQKHFNKNNINDLMQITNLTNNITTNLTNNTDFNGSINIKNIDINTLLETEFPRVYYLILNNNEELFV